jgi:hypothetical protein
MMKVNDSQLYALLAAMLDGTGVVHIAPSNPQAESYQAHLEFQVHDNHRRDSPDVILQVNITLSHPKLPSLNISLPIPIEGEKAGIDAALDDLRKFSERERFPLRLPMLVVGGAGNPARRTQTVKVSTKFEVVQVPYRALTD